MNINNLNGKTIKIGFSTFTIIFPYDFKERTDLQAQLDYSRKELRLRNRDPGGDIRCNEEIICSLFHEILHPINYMFNADKLDEDNISQLAKGLTQVFLDNFVFELK